MANTGFKGIDVRNTGNELVFRAYLTDTNGNIVVNDTVNLYLYELQSNGTLHSYDFNSNTFTTSTLTTASESMNQQNGNNGATPTGIWTYSLGTLTGFSLGAIYFTVITSITAVPSQQVREFQFGGDQGDLVVAQGGAGISYLLSNVNSVNAGAITISSMAETLNQILSRWLAITGSTTPATADTYTVGGFYNGTPYYQSNALGTQLFAWNNGSGFTISTAVGTNGTSYFTSSGTSANGSYTAQGSATGTPSAVAHGGAVLSGFQPDQTFMALVDSNGYLKTDVVDLGGSTTAGSNLANLYGSLSVGTAQAGGTNTITLASGASSVNNFYNLQAIVIVLGTGQGQSNLITAYNGSTKVASLESNWATVVDSTSQYVILGRVG